LKKFISIFAPYFFSALALCQVHNIAQLPLPIILMISFLAANACNMDQIGYK